MSGHECGYNNGHTVTDTNMGPGVHSCDLLPENNGNKIIVTSAQTVEMFVVDSVEPRVFRVLEKVSSTIDKNEERCDENDRKEQHELEWKQVALVIGTTFNSIKKNPFCRPPYQISPFVIIDVECRINVNSDWG